MELYDYFKGVLPILLLELMVALSGTYYLLKTPKESLNSRYLVYFLWASFLMDAFGAYAPTAYYSDFRYFGFIKGTPFQSNYWLFNLYGIINVLFYVFYFGSHLKKNTWRRPIKTVGVVFGVGILLYLVFSGTFFMPVQFFMYLIGPFLIIGSILIYYFELLRDDRLTRLSRILPFYISVGVLIFNIVITPFDILMEYFSTGTGNQVFVNLRIDIMFYSNLVMYSLFILGFILCSRKKKSY